MLNRKIVLKDPRQKYVCALGDIYLPILSAAVRANARVMCAERMLRFELGEDITAFMLPLSIPIGADKDLTAIRDLFGSAW